MRGFWQWVVLCFFLSVVVWRLSEVLEYSYRHALPVSQMLTLLSFGRLLDARYGVRYTLAPYLYIIGMFTICNTVAPMRWSRFTLPIQNTRSALRAQIARVIGNQEAVVAQKGSKTEASLIRTHLASAWKAVSRFSSAVALPNFCTDLAFTWWSVSSFLRWSNRGGFQTFKVISFL